MNKLRVSQSLIKDWWSYKSEEMCGPLFNALWIDRTAEIKPTDVMQMGNRFEFLCTGALLMDGSKPLPVLTKTGKPIAKQQYLIDHVPMWKRAVEQHCIKNIKINQKLEVDVGDYIMVLRPDIIAEKDGIKSIFDIKSTGLLNDRWKDFGWHPEYLGSRHKLTVQAKMSKLICQDALHIEDIPFYWFVFSSTGDRDASFYEAKIEKQQIAKLVDVIEEMVELIEIETVLGFTPYPKYKRCMDCPAKEGCKDRITVPEIITIYTK